MALSTTPRLNKLERLAGPSVPSFATPNSWLDLTPRFSQRAERRGCAPDHVVPCPATKRAPVLLIENDSISQIGPINGDDCRKPLSLHANSISVQYFAFGEVTPS